MEDYTQKAYRYYTEHKAAVDSLIKQNGYFADRPGISEIDRPEKWTANHWLWFLQKDHR